MENQIIRVVLISEAGLHSAAVLAETIISMDIEADVVLHSGDFFLGDYESGDCKNGDVRNMINYQVLGELTTIISQLENIGRVVYIGDSPSVDSNAPSLTSQSSNANSSVVEVASSLFVTGVAHTVSSTERSSILEQAHSSINCHLKQRCGEQVSGSVVLIESDESETGVDSLAVLHVCKAPKRRKESKISNDEVVTVKSLVLTKPLWACGGFTVVTMECVSDKGWSVSHREDHCIDISSRPFLPYQR